MKWLDIFAAWCTTLKSIKENSIDDLLQNGQFIAIDQAISIQHAKLAQFCACLQRLGAQIDLVQLAQNIQRQHKLSQIPLYLRVEIEPTNREWQKQCNFLFKKRILLNWRSLLSVENSKISLEYIGQSWTSMDLLENCNASPKELAIIVFQLLWTFCVLARCEIMLQIDNWAEFFGKIYVQRNRVDYFQQSGLDYVLFVREQCLDDIFYMFRVPVRQAFVHICYEPKNRVSFGHRAYRVASQRVLIENMSCEAKDNRFESLFFANFALRLKQFLFPRDFCATTDGNRKIFDGLAQIANAENSVNEFLFGTFAEIFAVPLNLQQRPNILRALTSERSLSVLYMPMKDQQIPPILQQRNFKSDIIGFPNVENNCFLNSVLFMLMFPNDFANSFAETIATYADMIEATSEEIDSVRNLKEEIKDANKLETMRRLIARLFSKILQTAFIASQSGDTKEEQKIRENCSHLLPLLDVWSLASRGQFFAQFVGEFQDLDECLRLLHSLLLFESCCVSTIAVTEEFPNLLYENGEKLGVEALEQLSLQETQNPLCLRVTSCLESPIIRFESSTLDYDEKVPIDLEKTFVESMLECSIVPSPLDAVSKEIEKQTNVKMARNTRFNCKKTQRSRGMKTLIIHIFRQSVAFVDERMVYTVKKNLVCFPANEILSIDGNLMKVQSLALWGKSHYTSLIFCKKTSRWWHVNDMMSVGYRFEDFGTTLNEAVQRLNRLGYMITTINCIAVNESFREKQLNQQFFVELPKYCHSCDTLQGKAILFHKDKVFSSARSTISKFSQPLINLPERFLFGYDDPNKDFIFLSTWYSGKPLPKQTPQMSLAIASGFTPTMEHALDLPLDFYKSLENDIATKSTIMLEKDISKVQTRAAENFAILSCIASSEKMPETYFYSVLLALNARACNLNATKFMQSTESAGILPQDCVTKFWIMDQLIIDALLKNFDTLTIAQMMQSRTTGQIGNYLQLEKLVFAFYVEHSGFLVLVEPKKNQIIVYDPFGHKNDLILQRVVSLMLQLEQKANKNQNILSFASYKLIYGTMSMPPNHVGCDLISLCVELMKQDSLENYDAKKNLHLAAFNFSVFGRLNK